MSSTPATKLNDGSERKLRFSGTVRKTYLGYLVFYPDPGQEPDLHGPVYLTPYEGGHAQVGERVTVEYVITGSRGSWRTRR